MNAFNSSSRPSPAQGFHGQAERRGPVGAPPSYQGGGGGRPRRDQQGQYDRPRDDEEEQAKKYKVAGLIKRIMYQQDGFYLMRVAPHNSVSRQDEMVVKGNGIDLHVGRDVIAVGYYREEMSPEWGPQRVLDSSIIFERIPTTRYGIQKLLENGYVKGIGPFIAGKLCDAFGDHLFDVAEEDPDRLMQVPGIKRMQAIALSRTIREKKEIPRLMSFLAEVGLNIQTSYKVLKELGPTAIDLIRHNPYNLTRVPSIGFGRADQVARDRGVVFDSEERVGAALDACLENALRRGWTAMSIPQLTADAAALLAVEDPRSGRKLHVDPYRLDALCEKHLRDSKKLLVRQRRFPNDRENEESFGTEPVVSLMQYAGMERRIAKRLADLVNANITPEGRGARLGGAFFARLSDEQQRAVRTSLQSPVSVITGRPGCGKTTVTKALLEAMNAAGMRVLLVGPTNRAAKQMTDATRQRALTVHRALGCKGVEIYSHGPQNPLEVDAVIADEESMMDTRMMDKLLSAIRPGTALVLVGDREQLGSISAGKVFEDIIDSNAIPVSYLTEIRRTAKGSSINTNAHRVADRLPPLQPKPGENDDFCMREVRSAWPNASDEVKQRHTYQQIDALIDQFKYYLSKGHRPEDIQILTPMRRYGDMCANALNDVMKNWLQPVGDFRYSVTTANKSARVFSVGDRVMYTDNDLDRDIYNGDVGYVKYIDHECAMLVTNFYGVDVEMNFTDLPDMDLAYVNTTHKTQGGEYPAVIVLVVSAHQNMLDRQQLYTAMTRGKKDVCILGDTHILKQIVEKPGTETRQTMLRQEIQQAFDALYAANDERLNQRQIAGMRFRP